ncbi:hypothetical protein L6R53_30450 [Myxococcota bacterium]|nr:hypothetical protein [Myxococcota bacterium]
MISPRTGVFLFLALALPACKKDGDGGDDGSTTDGGAADGGGGQPSSGQEYYTALGYASCDLYLACTPEAQQTLSYEQCVENVDLAAQYYDLAFADCSFDPQAAQECLELLESLDCDGYDGSGTCADDIWVCP